METIELRKRDISKGNLLLVNANHPLPKHYQPDTITNLIHPLSSSVSLEKAAGTCLYELLEDLHLLEQIQLVSGYRTYDEQKAIYNHSIRKNGRQFTSKYVALPQCSEHQTGYAIDLGLGQEEIDFIRPYFPYDGVSQVLRHKAVKYGFIERYQEDKERITGISHEPWHFRYVGYPHALIINTLNFCLEEYIIFLKAYTQENPYIYSDESHYMKIFYVPMVNQTLQLTLLPNQMYQISGNNVDGFIITTWENMEIKTKQREAIKHPKVETKHGYPYIDYFRIIAAILVITIHVSPRIMNLGFD